MKINRVWKIVFFIYICFLLFFVVVKPFGFIDRMHSIQINRNSGIWNYSLDPFRSFSSYFRHRTDLYAYTNILGNIIPFVPFGFLIPIISKKYRRFIKTFSLCLIIIIGIESFQFVTMLGFFDIDDIFLNMIGCIIGYCAYGGFRFLSGKNSDLSPK